MVTTTSDKYSDIFGFTEMEVFQALDEYGLSDNKKNVKRWYDGFIFGSCKDIYNPWSILNYLDKREYGTYWVNTSANSLVGRLIRESNRDIKQKFEDLLNDKSIWCEIDEQNFFDTGNRMSGSQPERFYHGFVLGLLVEIIIKTGSKFTSYKKANLGPVLL